MLIWIRTHAGLAGVPHGVIRREQLEELISMQNLRERVAMQAEDVLAQARRQAESILEEARGQADALRQAVQAEAEQMRQAAYDEGMRRAVQEWHDRQATSAVDKNRVVREMHARLADIVTNAVERIVHSEDRAALYQRALRNVQSLTRGASSLKLRVGPQDHADAQACIASITDLAEAGLDVEIVADASLRPGSCIFESDLGVLDASLQTQLDGLRAAMERAVRRAVTAEEEGGGDAAG